MGLILFLLTIATLLVAYRFYAVRKSRLEVEPSQSRSTPARRYMDGIDFLPTPRGVLTGYQFKSISLDVVIGPVIAIQFGWLPAILWLLIGTVFFGWVQDYLVTILSMRRAGKTISDLLTEFFQPNVRSISLIFLLIYLLTILGQFGILLSTLLGRGSIFFSVLILVLAGLVAGQMIYRWRLNILISTLFPVLIIILGFLFTTTPNFDVVNESMANFFSSQGSEVSLLPFGPRNFSWQALISISVIMLICFLGAVLPVWRFTVPFNHLSSWIVIIGMSLAIGGYIYGTLGETINTRFEIPAFVAGYQPAIGPIWPILFVTLSSGAISGWNAVVSTFTTSRQIEKEPMTLPVTTGAKFTETVLVAMVIIFAATFGVSSGTYSPEQGFGLVAGPASVFAIGMARSMSAIGFPEAMGASFSALLLAIMILTIMQLVMRITRIVSADLLGEHIYALRNSSVTTVILIIITLVIIAFGFWQWLWVLFAGANQMLAAIALLLVSTWLVRRGKSYQWTLWPAIFMFITALAALICTSIYQTIISSQGSNSNGLIGNLIIFAFGMVFIGLGSYMFIAGWRAFNRARVESTN
jgi:carbon starvation protein